MISLTEYLKDPCGTLSVPYWKNKNIITPDHIKIVHQKDYSAEVFSGFTDEPYFRLIHRLENIEAFFLDGFYARTAESDDIPLIVDLINHTQIYLFHAGKYLLLHILTYMIKIFG